MKFRNPYIPGLGVEEARLSRLGLELTWVVGKRMMLVKVLKSICTLVG